MVYRPLFDESSWAYPDLLTSRDDGARRWLYWSGVLMGAVTLFSLAQKVFELKLAPAATHVVVALRAVMYPFEKAFFGGFGFIPGLTNLEFPYAQPEIIFIYVLIGIALVRILFEAVSDIDLDFSGNKSAADGVKASIVLILKAMTYSLIWPFFLIVILYYDVFMDDDDHGILRRFAFTLIHVVAVLLLMLAANAGFFA
ncbi:MAG: hypothetical protein WAN43_08065 [Rhodomicrobium sp.]|jgi:hypothetical protein